MPTTEAGKRLLAEFIDDESGMATFDVDTLADQIDAIEAEAREQAREEWDPELAVAAAMNHGEGIAAERARIRAAVEKMTDNEWRDCSGNCHDHTVHAVLAIIDREDTDAHD